jgi:hypothetical protein
MKKLTYIFLALATLISFAVFTACNKEDLTQNIDPTTIKPKHWGVYIGEAKNRYIYWDESRKDWIRDCDRKDDDLCLKFQDPRTGVIKDLKPNFTLELQELSNNKFTSIVKIDNSDNEFENVVNSNIFELKIDYELNDLDLGSNFNNKTLVLEKGKYTITKSIDSKEFSVSIPSYLK